MAVNYNKLWKMMIDKNMSKTELTHLAEISTNAMAKLGKNEDVRVNILEKLCTSLDCKLDDIVEFVPDSKESNFPQNLRKDSMLCRSVQIYINTN